MRNLSFVSLLIFLLTAGCTSIKPPGLKKCSGPERVAAMDHSPYKDRFNKMLFRASIDIRTDRLTGLLLIKKMSDSTIQIVFTNEIGMTFFNFIMKKDAFETGYCFEGMNKKGLINMFRTGFELMLDYQFEEKGRLTLCDPRDGNVITSGRSGRYVGWSGISGTDPKVAFINGMTNFSDKTLITFSDFSGEIPKSVIIFNPLINLRIRLEMISF